MKLPRAIASFGRAVLEQPKLFLVAFLCVAALTLRLLLHYPLQAGRDFHYHLLVSAINALPASDPVRALYRSVNPLDGNTLLYFVAYPFEKLTDPVRAFQIAITLLYYVGLPFSTACALVRVGRSPWASLLTFPLVYGMQSHQSGYYPYLCASFWLPLALAEFYVMQTSHGARSRNAGIACASVVLLAFLAHPHVYTWLVFLLAVNTLILLVWKLIRDGALVAKGGLRGAFFIGAKSLAMVAPSLLLVGVWSWKVARGGATATGKVIFTPLPEPTMHNKLFEGLSYLTPTSGDLEDHYLAALGILILILFMLGKRAKLRLEEPPVFEVSIVLTAISFLVLPVWYHGQTVATRQFDCMIWLLPLVLFPRVPKNKVIAGVAIAALCGFTFARMQFIGTQLQILNERDYAGLIKTAEACRRLVPHDRVSKLAFASTVQRTSSWQAYGIQQSHETFAALCGLETPVYDTNLSPHNLLSLRYRGNISAPPTILEHTLKWYTAPHIFDNFDYVLVKGWTANRDDEAALARRAELVAKYGDYQLWERK